MGINSVCQGIHNEFWFHTRDVHWLVTNRLEPWSISASGNCNCVQCQWCCNLVLLSCTVSSKQIESINGICTISKGLGRATLVVSWEAFVFCEISLLFRRKQTIVNNKVYQAEPKSLWYFLFCFVWQNGLKNGI